MTTTTKTKAPASAESWAQWLEDMDALQAGRVVGLEEARKALSRAEHHARYIIRMANQTEAMRFHHSPDETEHDTLHRLVRGIGNTAAKVQARDGWKLQPREHQQAIADLVRRSGEAAGQLEESRAQVAELEAIKAEQDQRLEDLEAQAPKASESGLAELRKERDAALDERDRINRALDNMAADDSPLAMAREAERTAQERLEEAEALVAMGEASADKVKAAKSAAAKAQKALETEQAEHRRQDAARRGLTRKREEADSRLETLSRAYRQALAILRWADLESAEAELLAQVNALAEPLRKMAAIHADLESAEPGSSYGLAHLEVKLPHLYHHAETGTIELGGPTP